MSDPIKHRPGPSRREFFKAAGAAGLSGLLLGRPSQAGAEPAGPMPQRPFGRSKIMVSSLALGGMFDTPTNQLLLKQALDLGVTYWDTAASYGWGRSEEGMGSFLAKNPGVRSRLFLVTKGDSNDPEGLNRKLEASLQRLKTDYVDLYLVHGISDIREMNDGLQGFAERAKSQGKIKLFGFSSHSNMADCLMGGAKLKWLDGAMVTYNFRLMHEPEMKAAVAAWTEAGLGLTAMKTQGGGPVRTSSPAELELAGRFLKRGFTDKQARLKAVWENPAIASVCSQMPNLTILAANAAAALDQTKLSARDIDLLDRLARETAGAYCAGCARICQAAVAGRPPVAEVMRCLMYYRDYGEVEVARQVFGQLPGPNRLALADLDYSLAERRCPQGLPIARLMQEAAALLA